MVEQKKVDRRIVDAEALEREAREANEALAAAGVPDPFDGDSVSIEVTKQINTGQFQQEISEQIGRQVQVALSVKEIGHIASEKEPGTLFVSPKSVGERALREAVERHVADDEALPDAGADAPATVQGVQFTEEAQAVLDKIREGGTATTKELTAVVAALAGVKTED